MKIINKLSAIIPVLTLVACVAAPPLQACPQLGVNVYRPDFRQRQEYVALHDFYACTSQNINIAAQGNNFGYKVWAPRNTVEMDMQRQALDYQWNLWQQIFARESTPLKAESEWIRFAGEQNAQLEQIRAAQAAEEAAEEAARAAQAAEDAVNEEQHEKKERKQHRKKHKKNSSSFYTPTVTTPSVSAPSGKDEWKNLININMLQLYMFSNVKTEVQTPHRLIQGLYHPDYHESVFTTTFLPLQKATREIVQKAGDSLGFNYPNTLHIQYHTGNALIRYHSDLLSNSGFIFRNNEFHAGVNGDFPAVIFSLKSTTSLQSQHSLIIACLGHELGHLAFEKTKENTDIGYAHHREFRCDAF